MSDPTFEDLARRRAQLSIEARRLRHAKQAATRASLEAAREVVRGFDEVRHAMKSWAGEKIRLLQIEIRRLSELIQPELKAIHDDGDALRGRVIRADRAIAEGREVGVRGVTTPRPRKAERAAKIIAAIREREEREKGERVG